MKTEVTQLSDGSCVALIDAPFRHKYWVLVDNRRTTGTIHTVIAAGNTLSVIAHLEVGDTVAITEHGPVNAVTYQWLWNGKSLIPGLYYALTETEVP